jgi:hypothetical protein
MIDKESLNKSIKFLEEIDLNDEDISLIFKKFENKLNEPKLNALLNNKMKFLEKVRENESLKEILRELIKKSQLKDLNLLLEDLIKDESLTTWLQDFFLEKII